MIEYSKNGMVKFLSPESTLIPLLKAEGWVAQGEERSLVVEDHPTPRRGRPPKEKEVSE